MGIFEDILASSRRPDYRPVDDAAFPELTPAVDEAALAEEARQKAGERLIRANRRRPTGYEVPDAQSAGVQLEMNNAPAGTGVPFSTQAGMLAPPVTVGDSPGPIPIPRPRPPSADQPLDTDISSQGRAPAPPASPIQIAPQVPQAAPQQAPEPFGLPSILDKLRTGLGNNSNTLLALGAGLAGAPNWGQGISRAAAAAIPARAADIKQSLDVQSRTYGVKALIDAGVPVQQAIAAQGDTELKKALIKNYIEDRQKKIVKVGVDRYGADIMAEHDPFSGKLTPIDLSKLTANNPAAPTAENDVTGPDYLERMKQQDPAYARKIESMINGDIPLPNINTKAGASPQARRELQDALTVDPTLNATDHMGRFQRAQEYSQKGKTGKNVTSINTAITHAGNLHDLIPKLDNFNYFGDVLNPAWSAIRRNLSKDYQTTLGQWETNRQGLSDELEAAMRGGGTSVAGINDWKKTFNEAKSPEQLKGAVQQAMKLLSGRLNEVASSYTEDMKRHRDPIDFIRPENRQLFQRLQRGEGAPAAATTAAPTEGSTAVNRQTGQRIIMRGGQWQPVQ